MLFGRTLEPLWGPEEFLRFTLLVNVLSAVATFASYVLLYSLSQMEELLYAHSRPLIANHRLSLSLSRVSV
jgi:hypothetical protein